LHSIKTLIYNGLGLSILAGFTLDRFVESKHFHFYFKCLRIILRQDTLSAMIISVRWTVI